MNIKILIQLCMFLVYNYSVVEGQELLYPKYTLTQTLVSSTEYDSAKYLAFPSILRLNSDEILISYKRGLKHGGDSEASLEMLYFNTKSNKIVDRRTLAHDSGIIHQMGEWVKFPDQTIGLYIDSQTKGHDSDNYRAGMHELRVKKISGKYIPEPTQPSPFVEGREYGYPFDFVMDGKTTYMLVMGFGYRPGGMWSVDVIKSDDNGQSWKLVRNLTEEFGGHRINESSFIPIEDGFLVTTREYGHHQRIYQTDKDFKLVKERNLSADNEFIESHIGRPRLFEKDGSVYLMGRNWRTTQKEGRKMELALFRLNPLTLDIEKTVILDNKDRANITDGYYAVHYFQEKYGVSYFNVITYKGANGNHPSIIHQEFLWDEIK